MRTSSDRAITFSMMEPRGDWMIGLRHCNVTMALGSMPSRDHIGRSVTRRASKEVLPPRQGIGVLPDGVLSL